LKPRGAGWPRLGSPSSDCGNISGNFRRGGRALLVAELERASLSGTEVPGGDLLLQEVRCAVREFGDAAPRIADPAREFFRSIEPFLVDGVLAYKQRGRIARASLAPIWAWIGRDLVPDRAKAYSEGVARGLVD